MSLLQSMGSQRVGHVWVTEQQKQQNFTRYSAEKPSVAPQDREEMSVETQQRSGPGLCLRLAPRFRLGNCAWISTGRRPGPASLAAWRLLKRGWEGDRKAGTAKLSLALYIAPCPSPYHGEARRAAFMVWLLGTGSAPGRAVIMTHPLKVVTLRET